MLIKKIIVKDKHLSHSENNLGSHIILVNDTLDHLQMVPWIEKLTFPTFPATIKIKREMKYNVKIN